MTKTCWRNPRNAFVLVSAVALSACSALAPDEPKIKNEVSETMQQIQGQLTDTTEFLKLQAQAAKEQADVVVDKAGNVVEGAKKIQEGIEQIQGEE